MDIVLERGDSNPNPDVLDKMQGSSLFPQIEWPPVQMPEELSPNNPATGYHHILKTARRDISDSICSSLEEEGSFGTLLDLNKRINGSWVRLKTSQKSTGLKGENRDTILREVIRCSEDLFHILQKLNCEVEQSQLHSASTSQFDSPMPPYNDAFAGVGSMPRSLLSWASSDDGAYDMKSPSLSTNHSISHNAVIFLCLGCYSQVIEIYEADVNWLYQHLIKLLSSAKTSNATIPAASAIPGCDSSLEVSLHLDTILRLVGRLDKTMRLHHAKFLNSPVECFHNESGSMGANASQGLAGAAFKALGEREQNLQEMMWRLKMIADSSPVF